MPFHLQEVVWAKIRGFPFWPAKIASPSDAGDLKFPKRKNLYFVVFFSAAEGVVQNGWCGDGEILEWTSHLTDMKDAAKDKGGKTYIDLRKCIEIGEKAHKAYMEELDKNPNAFSEMSPINSHDAVGGAAVGEASAGKVRAKPGPKPKSQPVSAKKSNLHSVTQPEPLEAQVVAPRLTIKLNAGQPQSVIDSEEPSSSSAGTRTKRISKKRVLDEEETPIKPRAPPKLAKIESKSISIINRPLLSSSPSRSAIAQAKLIQVGFIGLEDARTKQVAKTLLDADVSVRVWSKDQTISKDLEYSRAERVSEPEKMFEETDVVFVSALNSYDLHELLSGADQFVRKIRPQGKNKLKGVCIFGAMSRTESEELARKMEAKNILYLECAWIGSQDELTFVAAHSKKLYDHITPILDITTKKSSFIGQDCGQALVVSAAASIADSVAVAGLVEAAYFAQQNGVSLDLLSSSLNAFANAGQVGKCRQILDFPRDQKDSTISLFKQHYGGLRDAVHLAHPSSGPSSITHLASFSLDLYKTHFVTYRYEREQDAPYVENRLAEKVNGLKEENGVTGGLETNSMPPSGKEKSGVTNGSVEEMVIMNGIGLEEKTETVVAME